MIHHFNSYKETRFNQQCSLIGNCLNIIAAVGNFQTCNCHVVYDVKGLHKFWQGGIDGMILFFIIFSFIYMNLKRNDWM